MTFRMATPEDTQAFYGKPLILFGARPSASSGTTSTYIPIEAPEVTSLNSAQDPPRNIVEGMERQVMEGIAKNIIKFPDYEPPSWYVPPSTTPNNPE